MEFSSNHPSSCNIDIENHSGIDEKQPVPVFARTDEDCSEKLFDRLSHGQVVGLVELLLSMWNAQNRAKNDQKSFASKPATTDELMPLVQAELRRVARRYLAQERPGHTLQPTALINEAYMRLAGQREYQWQNHAQFIAVAAQLM